MTIMPRDFHIPRSIKSCVLQVQLIHGFMFVAALAQIYILHWLKTGSTQTPSSDPTIPYVITLIAIVDLGIILLLRRFMLDKALPTLKQNPTDSHALLRWRTAMILTSAGVYSCFLFGWVIAFLGTTYTWTYGLLWTVAAVGAVILAPKMPIDEMTLTPHNPPPRP